MKNKRASSSSEHLTIRLFPYSHPNGPLCSLENSTINSSPFICTTALPGPTQTAFLLGSVPASTSVYLMICNSYIINQSTRYLLVSILFFKVHSEEHDFTNRKYTMIKVFLKLPEKGSFLAQLRKTKNLQHVSFSKYLYESISSPYFAVFPGLCLLSK